MGHTGVSWDGIRRIGGFMAQNSINFRGTGDRTWDRIGAFRAVRLATASTANWGVVAFINPGWLMLFPGVLLAFRFIGDSHWLKDLLS